VNTQTIICPYCGKETRVEAHYEERVRGTTTLEFGTNTLFEEWEHFEHFDDEVLEQEDFCYTEYLCDSCGNTLDLDKVTEGRNKYLAKNGVT